GVDARPRVLPRAWRAIPHLRACLPQAARPAPGHPPQQPVGDAVRRRHAHRGRHRVGHRSMAAVHHLVAGRHRPCGDPPMRAIRGFWRNLTSMRTALILLLLLAVAAVPGSLLPQKGVSIEKVRGYLVAHPDLGPWLERFWFFDVYSSPWFSAIYLLLF